MTPEQKQLLLKDLCARLPYGVKIHYTKHPNSSIDEDVDDTVQGYYCNLVVGHNGDYCIDRCKPYLRPMSSMTDEEMEEMHNVLSPNGTAQYGRYGIETPVTHIGDFLPYEYLSRVIDWLNEHHFDYRGLIEKGLAIAVTEDNNPYKD